MKLVRESIENVFKQPTDKLEQVEKSQLSDFYKSILKELISEGYEIEELWVPGNSELNFDIKMDFEKTARITLIMRHEQDEVVDVTGYIGQYGYAQERSAKQVILEKSEEQVVEFIKGYVAKHDHNRNISGGS